MDIVITPLDGKYRIAIEYVTYTTNLYPFYQLDNMAASSPVDAEGRMYQLPRYGFMQTYAPAMLTSTLAQTYFPHNVAAQEDMQAGAPNAFTGNLGATYFPHYVDVQDSLGSGAPGAFYGATNDVLYLPILPEEMQSTSPGTFAGTLS